MIFSFRFDPNLESELQLKAFETRQDAENIFLPPITMCFLTVWVLIPLAIMNMVEA